MRAYVPAYELEKPASLADALTSLGRGGLTPIAGGTDLMVVLEAGRLPPGRFLSLWHLAELREEKVSDDWLQLGALTSFSRVREHPVITSEFPMLAAAASETGAIAIQNRGTLGGNIANASPAADSPPALLAYNAELELISTQGRRIVAYRDFHLAYRKTALAPGELISAILLPRKQQPRHHCFRKVGPRRAQAISKICFAGVAVCTGGSIQEVAIALGSVAPTPLLCHKTAALLQGQPITPALIAAAQNELAQEISPIDDIRSTSHYRRKVAQNLLRDFLLDLAAHG